MFSRTFWWLHEKKIKGRKGFHQLILPPFEYKLLVGAIASGRQENVRKGDQNLQMNMTSHEVQCFSCYHGTENSSCLSRCMSVHIDRRIDR